MAYARAGGMTQSKLAEALGVSPGAISNWKSRGGVPLSSLATLVAITKVPFEEFISGVVELAPAPAVHQPGVVYASRAAPALRDTVLVLGRWIASIESPVLRDQAARALQSLGEHPEHALDVADTVERIAAQIASSKPPKARGAAPESTDSPN